MREGDKGVKYVQFEYKVFFIKMIQNYILRIFQTLVKFVLGKLVNLNNSLDRTFRGLQRTSLLSF